MANKLLLWILRIFVFPHELFHYICFKLAGAKVRFKATERYDMPLVCTVYPKGASKPKILFGIMGGSVFSTLLLVAILYYLFWDLIGIYVFVGFGYVLAGYYDFKQAKKMLETK